MADVFTPGSVRAADEAFDGLPAQVPSFVQVPAQISPNNVDGGGSQVDGPIVDSLALSGTPSDPNQTILITPQQTSTNNVDGDGSSVDGPVVSSLAISGTPSDPAQTVHVIPPQTANTNVDGGTFSPQSVNTINTTQNNVAGQVLGTGTPANVFV